MRRPCVTVWDARVGASSAALTCVCLGVVVLITAATDEGGVAWFERLARGAPLLPLVGALATGLTLASRRSAGELRALAALGRSPFQTGSAAVVGVAAVGLVAAVLLAVTPSFEARAFFPSVHAARTTYVYDAHDGAFSNVEAGFRVLPDGSLVLADAAASAAPRAPSASSSPVGQRLSAAGLTLVATVAFALVVALGAPGRRAVLLGTLLATAAATLLLLQAAGAGLVPAFVAPLPSTVLLLGAAWVIVRQGWLETASTRTGQGTTRRG